MRRKHTDRHTHTDRSTNRVDFYQLLANKQTLQFASAARSSFDEGRDDRSRQARSHCSTRSSKQKYFLKGKAHILTGQFLCLFPVPYRHP